MKKLFVVLAILFIGILLAGCTSQQTAPATATPTPTAVPTVVVTTAVPTPEPTKEVVVVVVNKTPNATPTATPTPVPSYTITFTQDMTIIPGTSATIPVGSKVIWVNNDSLKPHSVMATDPSDGAWFGGMTSATIPYGSSLDVTFNKTGAYEYTTVFQPETTGVIYVK
ncbi:hypothetical protein [Methanoregula sp.]|uniref:cupredoxin domain-containing protein n=1 Tax=Methanoregula sp. TaxID=2052170 RepID=UPI00236D30E0|nr:hypothetical protein [Methanoregula sp.]MDD1687631.1 hypothetical protein [Methanoregula sp.]